MEVSYQANQGVGHLDFPVHNGAMDLEHCKLLLEGYQEAASDPNTKVIVLWGGPEFFSNGIDLNSVHLRYNPTILAYKILKALNKVVEAVLLTGDKLVLSAFAGSAAAGGVMLGLAGDLRYARQGVVLNPNYVNMGLSGSEYWSILLPSLIGLGQTQKLIYEASPISAMQAVDLGLLHQVIPGDQAAFRQAVTQKAEFLASHKIHARLASKRVLNQSLLAQMQEQVKLELYWMKDCCNHEEFQQARRDFVEKRPCQQESMTTIGERWSPTPFNRRGAKEEQ